MIESSDVPDESQPVVPRALVAAMPARAKAAPEPAGRVAALSHVLPSDRTALLFVALMWAAQSCLLLDFVLQVAIGIPYGDEWELIGALTGHEPVTWAWLWDQHNEHRIPLPKLLYLGLERLAGYDFRACLVFDALALSLVAAACCAAVRRARGYATYTDAFFPFILLQWGQADNLTWNFQIAFVLSGLIPIIALTALASREPPNLLRATVLGVCAIAAPLCGGSSLPIGPALGVCTLLCAWELWRQQPQRRAHWLVPLLLGLASFAVVAFYFVDYARPAKHPTSPGLAETARAAWQVLTSGLGHGIGAYWPVGGYVVAALGLSALFELCACVLRERTLRFHSLRLLSLMGGTVVLCAGIAWARVAFYGGMPLFQSRYATLALAFVCTLYLAWELRPSQLGSFMQMSLFVVAALMVQRNRDDGHTEAMNSSGSRRSFQADLEARMPIHQLAAKHCSAMYYICEDGVFEDRIRMLRSVGAKRFANLPD